MALRDHIVEVLAFRLSGWTYQAIGDKFGVTGGRVRQVLVKHKRQAERGREIVERRLAGLKWGEGGLTKNIRQAKVCVKAHERADGAIASEVHQIVFPNLG